MRYHEPLPSDDTFRGMTDGVRRFWKLLPLTFALSFVLSWQVAVILILSEVVHEISHLAVARRHGVRDEGIVFSFLKGGVLLDMDGATPRATWTIAIAGPVSGAACALACLCLFAASGAEVFLSAAFWVACPVLLNVLPVFGKDGKMVLGVIADAVRSPDGENLSLPCAATAALAFVATTTVLAGVSAFAYLGLSRTTVIPFRFFF